jgi:ketosteroid isomerase-like protein
MESGCMVTLNLEDFVAQYHAALDEFFRGNPDPAKRLFDQSEDTSLANPFGPVAMGWARVGQAMDRAAANYRDGAATAFDTLKAWVTPDLAYLVEVESFRAKIGGNDEFATGRLRVTTVLRPKDGVWKIVHRHADPITTVRPAESVIQK